MAAFAGLVSGPRRGVPPATFDFNNVAIELDSTPQVESEGRSSQGSCAIRVHCGRFPLRRQCDRGDRGIHGQGTCFLLRVSPPPPLSTTRSLRPIAGVSASWLLPWSATMMGFFGVASRRCVFSKSLPSFTLIARPCFGRTGTRILAAPLRSLLGNVVAQKHRGPYRSLCLIGTAQSTRCRASQECNRTPAALLRRGS